MKIQRTLISTFRGMVVVSRSIPALSKSLGQTQPITFHPTSAFGPINPNTFAYSTWEPGQQALKPTVDSERDFGKNVPCVNAKRVNEGRSEHGHDESSRAFPKFCRPRPQEVLWENEIANTVRLIGAIVRPVNFAYTYSGHAYARTVLGVKNSHEDEPLWFGLMFKDQLAEAVAQHLNENDRVYVSGCLTSTKTAGENDKPSIFYKVIVDTLNFVPEISPVFSKQVVVNKNTPSPIVPQPTVGYWVTPLQYQQSSIKASNSRTLCKIDMVWCSTLQSTLDAWLPK